MKRAGPCSISLALLLLLACVMERAGGTADGERRPPSGANATPGLWVLLEDRPELWSAPEGEPTGVRLEVTALQRVHATDFASGGERALGWIRVEATSQAGWLPDALLAPPPAADIDSGHLERIGSEVVDRYHGLPPEYAPSDLIEVAFGYETDRTYLLRREAGLALERMIRSARREGLDIQVVSAYRSYETQRKVYLGKLERSGWKQQTVAKPGHSEHQLGTTVDLTGSNESTLLEQSFGETREGRWLRSHAPTFGFAVSYTEWNRERTGYSPEPWHYRYYGSELAEEAHLSALGGEGE